jgi:hypothetical protein
VAPRRRVVCCAVASVAQPEQRSAHGYANELGM